MAAAAKLSIAWGFMAATRHTPHSSYLGRWLLAWLAAYLLQITETQDTWFEIKSHYLQQTLPLPSHASDKGSDLPRPLSRPCLAPLLSACPSPCLLPIAVRQTYLSLMKGIICHACQRQQQQQQLQKENCWGRSFLWDFEQKKNACGQSRMWREVGSVKGRGRGRVDVGWARQRNCNWLSAFLCKTC